MAWTLGAGLAAHLAPSVVAAPPARSLLGRTDPEHPHIALTFDDGPHPEGTPQILEQLRELAVRATFFVVGEQVRKHTDIARLICRDGHELAVHAWTHRMQLLRTPTQIRRDMTHATVLISAVAGVRPRYWRPPHGVPTGTGFTVARRLGLQPVLWSVDGRDWAESATAQSVCDRIIRRARPGAVVLLHDADHYAATGSWRATLGALAPAVEEWRRRGWQVGPLSEHGRFAAHPPAGGRRCA